MLRAALQCGNASSHVAIRICCNIIRKTNMLTGCYALTYYLCFLNTCMQYCNTLGGVLTPSASRWILVRAEFCLINTAILAIIAIQKHKQYCITSNMTIGTFFVWRGWRLKTSGPKSDQCSKAAKARGDDGNQTEHLDHGLFSNPGDNGTAGTCPLSSHWQRALVG